MIVLHNDTTGANALTGSIPSEIGNLTALKVLDLSNSRSHGFNALTGTVPSEIGNLTALSSINLGKLLCCWDPIVWWYQDGLFLD